MTTRTRPTVGRWLVATAVVTLVLAGCSSDDDGGSASDDPAGTTITTAGGDADGTATTGTATGPGSVEVAERQVVVGDLTFDVWEAGPDDGELVLLLHGFPQSKDSWAEVIEPLATAGYHVVAPDQRGYSPGARPVGDESYVITELVGDVTGMADALGADRFHVVGHDWGAAVAWTTAALAPERVLPITGLSVPHPGAYAAAQADPTSGQLESSGYVDTLVAPDAPEALSADGGAGIRLLLEASGLEGPSVDVFVERMADDPAAVDGAVAWYRANDLRSDLGGALPPVEVPALFVWSTDDVAITQGAADRNADFMAGPSTYEVLPGVSHWIPEQAPDEVVALLLDHLADTADG